MANISTDEWQKIIDCLKGEITLISFNTWISPIKPVYIENNTLFIEVPTDFHKTYLQTNLHELLKNTIKYVKNVDLDIKYLLPEEAKKQEEIKLPGQKNMDETPTGLNPRYIFENFVIGNNNRFAHAAALAVAESPAKAYNPLFLYGGVGLGKTHLMHAIGHYILQQHPEQKVLYITCEKFIIDFINAIKEQGAEGNNAFRKRYRNVDVLLVDDIQFIAGKEGTQEEFFHTFNTLYEANKQIIISSDRPPKDIEPLEDRLRSRFEWGLTADVQAPDYETRIAILSKKAQLDGITVPDEINAFIAERVDSNIRELEGSLNRVLALAHLNNKPLTLDLAKEALKDITNAPTKIITIDLIQKVVSKYFNIKVEDLKSTKKSADIAIPRQIAMYLCRDVANMSLPKIGFEFGKRDHSTVIHACNKISKNVEEDPELNKKIEEIKKILFY